MLTQRMKFIVVLIAFFSFFPLPVSAEEQDPHDPRVIYHEAQIDPKATYLRTCNDNAHIALGITLGDPNNVHPGDWVVLRKTGFYQPVPGWPDDRRDLVGVFSAYSILFPDEVTRLNRLRDSIFINPPHGFATQDTAYQCVENEGEEAKNLSTDIPQDFYIGTKALQIPSGAKFLFLTTNSDLFYDNSDPNGDFKLRFTDELKWEGKSSVDNSWNNLENWDANIVPRPDFGVTFDSDGLIEVSNADSEIKYLRIIDGDVKFDNGTNLKTTICDGEKYSFLVDGGKMYLAGGKLNTCVGYIGYHEAGSLFLSAGGLVEVDNGIAVGLEKGSIGGIYVFQTNSLLRAAAIQVSSGLLSIFDEGSVRSTGLIFIGNEIDDTASAVAYVNSGGWLYADDKITIKKKGILMIDGGGVEPINGIHVKEGGSILGCHSGLVAGMVINQGGTVQPGCSTGKLIINGDYIQESTGTLVIEVGGYKKGEEYDVLEVTGNVTLNGTLQVNFVNGFAPKQGDVFEFTNVTGSVSQNLSKIETNCVADDFQHKTELVGGKLTMTALNDARPIPCGGPKAMPWIPLLLLDD